MRFSPEGLVTLAFIRHTQSQSPPTAFARHPVRFSSSVTSTAKNKKNTRQKAAECQMSLILTGWNCSAEAVKTSPRDKQTAFLLHLSLLMFFFFHMDVMSNLCKTLWVRSAAANLAVWGGISLLGWEMSPNLTPRVQKTAALKAPIWKMSPLYINLYNKMSTVFSCEI